MRRAWAMGGVWLSLLTAWCAAQSPGGGGPPGGPLSPEELIRQFDRDGDGRISRDEAPPRMRERWDQIDSDHDGFITLEELRARDNRVQNMQNGGGQPGGPGPAQGPRPGTSRFAPASHTAATVPAKITGSARIYVRAGAAGDGTSWDSAVADVQAGIDAAAKQGGGEVWVAQGTYYPTTGNDRNATFRLRSGVGLLGGFAGNETQRDARDVEHHVTVLSGDIGRRDVLTDNVYHVVTGADNALLDGFVITGGYSLDAGGPGRGGPPGGGPPRDGPPPDGPPGGGFRDGPPPGRSGGGPGERFGGEFGGPPGGGFGGPPGGGFGGPPGGGFGGPPRQGPIHTTPQAVMSGASRGSGAGMLNFQCAPTIRNCTFQGNQAGKGGAVYNMVARSFPPSRDGSVAAPLFVNCRFLENHARGRGGAVANDLGTNPTFNGCTLLQNACDEKGGAMYNDFACSPTLVNCLLAENRATSAAAMGNDGGSSPRVVCCTFTRNVAEEEGAALYQGTGPANCPLVVNSILWDDRCENGPAEVYNWHDNDPQIRGSCIQGGYCGADNVTVDPGFQDPDHGDYRPRTDSPCAKLGYTAAAPDELPELPAGFRPAPPDRRSRNTPNPRAASAGPAEAVLHVRAGNTARPQDGRSWKTAFASLRDALAAAAGRHVEIWVAAGTYKPTADNDRSQSFVLHEGVELYGGFSGHELRRTQRDHRAHLTILSGDIGRPDDPADNSYHVLIGADGAVLDGFVIRDGNADGATYDGKGGGMINYRRGTQAGPMVAPCGYSPVVSHCVFLQNHAQSGGAVYNYDRGTPQFAHCRFMKNTADYGGAMVDRVGVRAQLSDCEFLDNQARWRAGALYLDYGSRPALVNCRFQGNRSQCHGGALATISRASQLESTIAVLRQCTFLENQAARQGGAIANRDHATLGLQGCTFTANEAALGGAISNHDRARTVLVDCHFAENRAQQGTSEVMADGSSTISRDRDDWPDQDGPATPAGFGPPR